MRRETLAALLSARTDKRALVLATWLSSGRQLLVDVDAGTIALADAAPAESGEVASAERGAAVAAAVAPQAPQALLDAARAAAQRDRSQRLVLADEDVFLRVYNPPLRLVVVGAVHIAQALCPMAALAGFAVTVVDPRAAFATAERFPGVALSHAWPDRAVAALELDQRTALVTLTHDPKLDEPALVEALRSPSFYIGALGSRRTQAARLTRLRERGFEDAQLERIHGPVGLDIGARSAAEIAISILAELVARLRGGAVVSAPPTNAQGSP